MKRIVTLLVAVGLATSACTNGDDTSAPGPSTSSSTPGATLPPRDYSKVQLATVEGTTSTTVALRPGTAILSGQVFGPDGPVQATVEVTRFVGTATATEQILTGPLGRWRAEKLLGGRYRVRAWSVPDLALVDPVILYLEAGQAQTVSLDLDTFGGLVGLPSITPDPPPVGRSSRLRIQLTLRRVDQSGRVIGRPVARTPVDLVTTPGWELSGEPSTTTNKFGLAEWLVTCTARGVHPVTVIVGGTDSVRVVPPRSGPRPRPATTTTSTTTPG